MCTTDSFRGIQHRYKVCGVLIATFIFAGCRQEMADQPRYDPLEESDFFSNGMSARQAPAGTVARGHAQLNNSYFTGKINGKPVATLPEEALKERTLAELLPRGQQRFNIYCAACHDRIGTGHGMVVRRGFPAPPSFHSDRLLQAPLGHFFDVATQGFGRMPAFAGQISVEDRWAIAAYIRALQLSQNASAAALPAGDRQQLPGKEGGSP
jgi:mono/diheme cytochrome c family protein